MSTVLSTAILLAALLAPARGTAQWSVGARLGYAHGLGDVGGDLPMGDWIEAQLPLQLDVTYRLRPNLSLGASFAWGYGIVGGDAARACDAPGTDCSASIRRLGVLLVRPFAPIGRVTPWLGAGAGYEWSTLTADRPEGRERARVGGWEYLSLHAGADHPLHPRLAVGPWLSLSIGQYGEGGVGGADGDVRPRELHAWLGAGVRGRWDL